MSETAPENDDGRGRTTADGHERPSMRVVRAVAAANDADPIALAPLYDVIDPDALDRLFAADAAGSVQFVYEGRDVVVDADGSVTVDGELQEGR